MKDKFGDGDRQGVGANEAQNFAWWLGHASWGMSSTSYGPTASHARSLQYAKADFAPLRERLNTILTSEIPALRQSLLQSGAPWGQGQIIPGG